MLKASVSYVVSISSICPAPPFGSKWIVYLFASALAVIVTSTDGFLIPHHPYAISLLLKISDGFRVEEFCRLGLTGSSGDWERLVRGVIREFEEGNSGEDLFHFDSDEDVFCVYSQYIDDLMMLAKMIRAACADEKTMGMYLNMSEAAKA